MPAALVRDYTFHITSVLGSITLSGSLVGAVLMMRRFGTGQWLFPIVYGAIALVVHSFHRPYFLYYNVHLAAGLCPVAAWGLMQAADLRPTRVASGGGPPVAHLTRSQLARWAALLCVWLITDGTRTARNGEAMLCGTPPGERKMVRFLGALAPRVEWAFSRSLDSSFLAHSGMKVVPELAVLSDKRYWGGYIQEEEVIGVLRRYRPEVLLLPAQAEKNDPLWRDFLRSEYWASLAYGGRIVYCRRDWFQSLGTVLSRPGAAMPPVMLPASPKPCAMTNHY